MEKPLRGISSSIPHILRGMIIILFFCSQLLGLNPDKPVNQYLVAQWQVSAGIPSNAILSVVQTPDGYLWIATEKGLVRFDGLKFSVIDFTRARKTNAMENPIPTALFVDKQGVLWIGSSAGLTSYRFQTGEFNTLSAAHGITKDGIRRIREDIRGDLWISFFASYINRFSNGKFTKFNASHGLKGKKINAIIEDQKGNLLLGAREHGVFIFRQGKFLQYPVAGLDNPDVIAMYEDRKGELWIGTTNGLYQVADNRTRRYTTVHGLANDYITSIIEDSDGNLWVGTFKGLYRIKKKQDGSLAFEGVLQQFTITYLFEDREKNLWVGTLNSGCIRLNEGKFSYYEPLGAYPEEVFLSLYQDGAGDIHMGTFSGKLFHWRANDLIESGEPPAISGTGIVSIAQDADGNLWLGTTGKGILKKRNKTYGQLTTREGLSDNLVTSIFKDSRDNLWLSTFDGVSVIPPDGSGIETLNSQRGLSGKVVHNVYEDNRHNIWIAADKGVTVLKDGKIVKESMEYYLQGVNVTCIYEDLSASENGDSAGRVFWLATHGAGLKRLKLPGGAIVSYTTANGMTTNSIYQFLEDHQGNFWLMSNSGILRVSKKVLNQFADAEINIINCASFGISDGLKSLEFNNEFSRHSALKTRDGEFWFVNKEGIAVVNPEKIPINKVPPPLVLETVLFNEQPVSLQQETAGFKGITDLRFHFTAPTFLSPEKIKFKYQLQGFDREWMLLPPGSERMVQYKNLEPGTYTFKVIACNSEGVWNQRGVSMNFTLKPYFHETLAFKIILLVVLAGLGAAGFYFYKKWPLKKQEKYKGSPLTPQFAEECIKKLRRLMEVEKIYRDPDISLQLLAEKLSVTAHLLSQILNEKLNRNFSDFINFYRIEEAKEVLESSRGAEQKIIAIAFDVGFNTKVAFYNAFKKYTGMTPAEYRKKAEESKES